MRRSILGGVPPTTASGTGAELLLDLDFTTQPTDDWSAISAGVDTAVTIDGVTWTARRDSGADSFGLVSGTGLRVGNSTTAGGSWVQVALTTLLSGYTATDHLVVEWAWAGAGLSALYAAQLVLLDSATGLESVHGQVLKSGTDYAHRVASKLGGVQVSQSPLVGSQTTAPANARAQLDYWKSTAQLRGDLDAGSTLGPLDSLSGIGEASRTAQTAGAIGSVDGGIDTIRWQVNPGGGGQIDLKRLRISRLGRS